MLSARISSYGCTWEVWRAREKRKSCLRREAQSRATLASSVLSKLDNRRMKYWLPIERFSFFLFFFSIFLFSLLLLFFFPGRTFFLFLFLFFREERQKHSFVLQAEMSQIALFPFSPTVGKPPIPACTSKQNVLNLKAHLPFGILAMSS